MVFSGFQLSGEADADYCLIIALHIAMATAHGAGVVAPVYTTVHYNQSHTSAAGGLVSLWNIKSLSSGACIS